MISCLFQQYCCNSGQWKGDNETLCALKPHLHWKDFHLQQVENPSLLDLIWATLVLFTFALRMAKTLWSFGHSECKRAKSRFLFYRARLSRKTVRKSGKMFPLYKNG